MAKKMVTIWAYNLRKQNEPYKRTPRHHKEALELPNNGNPHFVFSNAHSFLSFSKLSALSLLKWKTTHTLPSLPLFCSSKNPF